MTAPVVDNVMMAAVLRRQTAATMPVVIRTSAALVAHVAAVSRMHRLGTSPVAIVTVVAGVFSPRLLVPTFTLNLFATLTLGAVGVPAVVWALRTINAGREGVLA
jgi:hypothetical protein